MGFEERWREFVFKIKLCRVRRPRGVRRGDEVGLHGIEKGKDGGLVVEQAIKFEN